MIPNFVINGTKLLFINSNSAKEEIVNPKDSKIESNKPKQPKDIAIQSKAKNEKDQKQTALTPLLRSKHTTGSQKNTQEKQEKKKVQRIVNFDQSFQPEFKPEQFTNENTYVLQENQYLESLEEELQKLASQKKLPANTLPNRQSKPSNNDKSKQHSQNEEKKQITTSQRSIDHIQQEPIKIQNNQNSNSSINQNQNSSNVSSNHQNSVQKLQACKIDSKDTAVIEQKVFKYKMKIITSHEIQIEGDGQPNVQEIQREIMQGIKTGKLTINDLAASKKVPTQHKSAEMNNSNESSKEAVSGSTSYTQKSAPAANFFKDNCGKVAQSSHQPSKRESNLNHNAQVLQTRASDLQQAKMRSINEIIEKIGIKTNQVFTHTQESKDAKMPTGPVYHEQCKASNINSNSIPNYKTQRVEIAEQKMEKAENYRAKIKQAKEKAENLLRQYTKKKQ